ncbi:hypothetical protein B0H14DRAFT_372888 [Mycena olivaceomarginata]|nr:hypothetical protein B0H14DRAFT_372888 [Mycena olivaceomarginata]
MPCFCASIPSDPLRNVGLIVRSARVRSLARLRVDSHSPAVRVPSSHPIFPTTSSRHDTRLHLTPLYPPHSSFYDAFRPIRLFSGDTPPHLASPLYLEHSTRHSSIHAPRRTEAPLRLHIHGPRGRADHSYIVDFALARTTACVSTLSRPSYTYIVSHLSWTYGPNI